MSDEALLQRARTAAAEKIARGAYPPQLLDALAEPLDLRPDPGIAAGGAWPEVLRSAEVRVEAPPPSPRPLVGPLIGAGRRLVARALRWYLPPVAEQVSRHNRAVVDVLQEHNRHIVELHLELERLRRRVAALERELGEPAGDDGALRR